MSTCVYFNKNGYYKNIIRCISNLEKSKSISVKWVDFYIAFVVLALFY